VENGAVRLRPDSNWTSDLSLPEKYYTDGTFEVDLKCLSGAQWYGIALRKMGPEHFWSDEARNYMIFLRPSGALDLYCNKGGGTLATATVPGFVASDWNTLSVTISGYNFSIKVNGIERINHTDSNQTYPGGWVSLICNNSMEVWFDNFSVTATGDSTAPAPISGFSVSPTGQASQLALSWTNPSDSDYLWTRIMRKEGSSPIHYDDGLPIYQGFMAGFVDRDVSNGTAYYYAAYAVDHSGNYSAAVAGSGIPGGALPVAEFSGVPMSGESPLEVVFTDLSSNGPTEWAWDFENDSVIDSVEQNPTHTYDRPGTYSVKLTATNVDGSDSELKTGLIEVLPNSAQARYWPFYE
jgi:PKD repeat protein